MPVYEFICSQCGDELYVRLTSLHKSKTFNELVALTKPVKSGDELNILFMVDGG